MIRKIIHINEEKCNGCELCIQACHEGAIGMVNGKAKLLRDDYCDGLGDCLPVCPTGAVTFEEREAAAYDKESVKENQKKNAKEGDNFPCECHGNQSRQINREKVTVSSNIEPIVSALQQWPVQIKLAPVNAPYFNNAHLLIAADCTAYAYGNFHKKFIQGKITLIGCPKLDESDYSQKLTEIIRHNEIKSVTVVRMEVPCCGGIQHAVVTALKNSGKFIPWQVVIISTDGNIIEN